MFEQALGLDKSFNFDAAAQRPVQNFDIYASTKNLNNIASNQGIRTRAEAVQLADQEIATFDRNAQEKTQFIRGNNNFSINQIAGFERELSDVLQADRDLLVGQRNRAIDVAGDREDKDQAELLRETNRLEDLQDAALNLGLDTDFDDIDTLSEDIAKEQRRRNDLKESSARFDDPEYYLEMAKKHGYDDNAPIVPVGTRAEASEGSFIDNDGDEISNQELEQILPLEDAKAVFMEAANTPGALGSNGPYDYQLNKLQNSAKAELGRELTKDEISYLIFGF